MCFTKKGCWGTLGLKACKGTSSPGDVKKSRNVSMKEYGLSKGCDKELREDEEGNKLIGEFAGIYGKGYNCKTERKYLRK